MGKKKTHEEYVNALKIKNPNIEVVGTYIDAKTKIQHRCKIHDYYWDVSPDNALNKKGCPKCAGNIKKTHNEYVAELAVKNPSIEVVGKYNGSNTKILHRCMIDGFEWNTTPHNILSGKGCPQCSGNVKKTHEQYIQEVLQINPNIEVLGKYINLKTPILHKCLTHNLEWMVTPSDILIGHGCRLCGNEKISNARKSNHEQYIKKLKNINPNIIVIDKYIDSKTPILHKCLLDKCEWHARPNGILRGRGCPVCAEKQRNVSRTKTHDDYIYELSVKNPNIKAIEKYVNAKTKILHHCLTHDYYWKTCPDNVLNGSGCPECRKEKLTINNKKTHDEYVKELKIKNPTIDVLEQYVDIHTPIWHKCIVHNFEWQTTPCSVLQGCGCPKCKSEKISNSLCKSHKQYLYELKKVNPNVVPLENYVNSYTPILHKCLIDKNEWYTTPSKLLCGYGCPQCNESKGERQVRQWLEKHHIAYIFQKKFDNCRDIRPLPFDFYLPDFNTIVEYDHKQHDEPVEYFGGQEAFELTVKHDNIKNEYCKNNGISLLRIPYFKNVEEELNNFLFI